VEAEITQSFVRWLFSYDEVTGTFIRLVGVGGQLPGSIPGTVDRHGYRKIKINGKQYLAHRLAWLYVYGEWPDGIIDHKNRNTADNSIANLRIASYKDNSQNRREPCSNNKAGALGVRKGKKGGWQARITASGKCIHLGSYGTKEEASAAYFAAKAVLHIGDK
jgi:hypothetical protein